MTFRSVTCLVGMAVAAVGYGLYLNGHQAWGAVVLLASGLLYLSLRRFA